MMEKCNYLILGGSSGIGLAAAKLLAAKNNRVILVSSSERKLKEAKKQLPGSDHEIYAYDLEDISNIENIFAFLKEKAIRLHGMIYCAGVSPLCLLKDNSPELTEHVFRINLFAFIECCKYFQEESISFEGSKIVAIASVAAHKSGYRQVLYGSSKAALAAATKLLARELLNRNIKINCLTPAATETEMFANLCEHSEGLRQKTEMNQPLGIIPTEKVAEIIEVLLSSTGDYMTGTELIYDAGFLLG